VLTKGRGPHLTGSFMHSAKGETFPLSIRHLSYVAFSMNSSRRLFSLHTVRAVHRECGFVLGRLRPWFNGVLRLWFI
jgi:hypothetical protein